MSFSRQKAPKGHLRSPRLRLSRPLGVEAWIKGDLSKGFPEGETGHSFLRRVLGGLRGAAQLGEACHSKLLLRESSRVKAQKAPAQGTAQQSRLALRCDCLERLSGREDVAVIRNDISW